MRAYFRYAPETTGKSQKKGLKKTKGALSTAKSKPIHSAAVSARKSSRKGRVVTKASDVSISPPPAKLPSSSSRSRPRVYASEEVDEDDISRDEGGRALGMVTVRKKVPQPAPHQRGRSILAPEAFESIQKDTLRVDLVLPGLHAHEVEVFLSKGLLCVVAENAIVGVSDGPVITDRRAVRLEYQRKLAKGIQAEDIRAWMRNGVLTLTCPTEDKTPREIEILLPQQN
ncbi:hypothetical protein EYR40_010518 [Pleurotus pulmonarius]|nr:hypothetical protein EYR36_010093 [Pleurotus pulmonarius]KAF4588962.1 hypothetical protein EYR40_010518 [Pleurotus pulmonarius]